MTQEITQHASPRYRAEIDGLRAIAVMAVIFAHAGFRAFAGGFTGVDVFFTISGFVVTKSILKDLDGSGFSFAAFYARRAKRLVPALYLVAVPTFIFCILFLFPDDSLRVAKNMLALSTFVSNIFLSKQTGYFAPAATDQPLLHTWSLSVEEQFYLVLPLLLVFTRRWRVGPRLAMALCFATISFVGALIESHRHMQSAYYFGEGRAFEFLIGVAFALFVHGITPKRWTAFDVAFLVGIALILDAIFTSNAAQFPGVGALLPCLGTLLVLATGDRCVVAHRLLSNRLMTVVGRRSYAVYLWHWPIFFAFRKIGWGSDRDLFLGIVFSFALSVLSYRYVEQPWRFKAMSPKRTLVMFLLLPAILCGVLAGIGKLTHGFLFAYPKQIRQDFYWSGDALFDMPRGKMCWNQVGVTDDKKCTLGDAASTNKAVLWGDSHAYHLVNFMDELGKQRHMSIHDAGYTVCPPIMNEPALPGDMSFLQDHLACVQHDKDVMSFLMSRPDIKTVFLAAAWQNYQNLSSVQQPNGHGFLPGALEEKLGSTIKLLTGQGKHVVLMNDVPMIPHDLINCDFNNHLWIPVHKRRCEFDEKIAIDQHTPIQAMLDRLKARYPHVDIMHTYDVPCKDGVCKLDFDGRPIYRFDDYHHLSAAGSELLYPKYLARHPDEMSEIFGPLNTSHLVGH